MEAATEASKGKTAEQIRQPIEHNRALLISYILQYLKSKGFHQTAISLQQESKMEGWIIDGNFKDPATLIDLLKKKFQKISKPAPGMKFILYLRIRNNWWEHLGWTKQVRR